MKIEHLKTANRHKELIDSYSRLRDSVSKHPPMFLCIMHVEVPKDAIIGMLSGLIKSHYRELTRLGVEHDVFPKE